MKTAILMTGGGPLMIVTSHGSLTDPVLIAKLRGKGITKFVAYEVPLELAEQRYGGHFQAVLSDLRQTDDLRVLDFNGERAFRLFRLDELGAPIMYEGTDAEAERIAD
jgi:hypothetical protein